MSNTRKSILIAYVTNDSTLDGLILTDSDGNILNPSSLKSVQKRAAYSPKSKEIKIFRLDDEDTPDEIYSVSEKRKVNRNYYLEIFKIRTAGLEEYWSDYKKATSLAASHVARQIPLEVIRKRDETINNLPEPISILEVVKQTSIPDS